MSIQRGAAVAVASILLAAFLAGCDSAPGIVDDAGAPPVVANLEFSPDLVIFEELADSQVIGDTTVLFDVAISASALDENGDIDSVSYLVNTPFDAFEPLVTGRLHPLGVGNRYEGTARLEIPRGNSGLYTVIVFAVDREVQVSNQVRGLIEYRLEGGAPPVIETVLGPDSITPPTTFSFVAVVSDPDGLGNIASVVTRAPNGQTFDLFDDGEGGDDPIAGDGRYTVTFEAPEETAAGTVEFEFQAFDRQGLESNIVVKELTIN